MGQIDDLVKRYEQVVGAPWDAGLAGPQRVWFAIYDPDQERRLRFRLKAFELATQAAGRRWTAIDIADRFGGWLAGEEYRDAYFADPELLADRLPEFADVLAAQVRAGLTAPGVDEATVVGLLGVGSLFGLTRVAGLVDRIAPAIRGRLLVFFPGSHAGSTYRLLDARDGWNYLATPITAHSGA
jgi:hypothetical protein